MKHKFSDDITAALAGGRKIDAIKLLREERNIDLKTAKETIEAYLREHPESAGGEAEIFGYTPQTQTQKSFRDTVITLVVLAALVWAFVNIVQVVASLIIIINQDGYTKTTFTVARLTYRDAQETGSRWGLEGRLPDGEARLYAPDLDDAETLGYQGLLQRFPPGMTLAVWYNPAVTGELFQGRTLRVIPYTPDLVQTEIERLMEWINFCLLPLVVILFLAGRLKKSGRKTIT